MFSLSAAPQGSEDPFDITAIIRSFNTVHLSKTAKMPTLMDLPAEIHLMIVDILLLEPLHGRSNIQDSRCALEMVKGIQSLCSSSPYWKKLIIGAMKWEMKTHKRRLIRAREIHGHGLNPDIATKFKHWRNIVHRVEFVRHESVSSIGLYLMIHDRARATQDQKWARWAKSVIAKHKI